MLSRKQILEIAEETLADGCDKGSGEYRFLMRGAVKFARAIIGKIEPELQDELVCARKLLELTRMPWSGSDKSIKEDKEIDAAHPLASAHGERDCGLYEEACRLVGAKRSKYALVDLVNWLLHREKRAKARCLEYVEAVKAEVEVPSLGRTDVPLLAPSAVQIENDRAMTRKILCERIITGIKYLWGDGEESR